MSDTNTTPAEEATTVAQQAEQQTGEKQATEPLTWDGWFAEQPEAVRALIEGETKGLKSALETEREQRKAFQKQIKDLGKQAEEGTELRKSLDNLTSQIEQAQARADFYELAADPQLGLRDAKLAWAIISGNVDEFTHKGKPDFEALKAAHPVLFEASRPPARTNAGSGTAAEPAAGKTVNQRMNDFIRSARG